MNPIRIPLLAIAFVMSAWVAGCSATGSVGVDATIPIPGGGHVSVVASMGFGGQRTMDVDSTEQLCVQVCFYDAEGGFLGCSTLEVPATNVPTPEGAARYDAAIVKCPHGDSDGAGGAADGNGSLGTRVVGAQQASQGLPTGPHPAPQWTLFGGPLVPAADGSTNVSYSFSISAGSLAQAKARRDMVLAGGIGTPVGTGFDVLLYNETVAEFDITGLPTGVRMRQAELLDDFTSYRLAVNGFILAELGVTGNLLHYGAGNQWNVVETFVPTSDFDTSSTFDNLAEADWTTLETATPWHASQQVFAE